MRYTQSVTDGGIPRVLLMVVYPGVKRGIPRWVERGIPRVGRERYTQGGLMSVSSSHTRVIFPFHCWLKIRRPCATVLSVAGLCGINARFTVGLSPVHHPFHCWTSLHPVNTRFTVDHILGYSPVCLSFLTFLRIMDVRKSGEQLFQQREKAR